ncbi:MULTISPECIES: hypothetical protein [Leptospira]|uniref:Uncharacterized protein n=4 Tax=Leptospira borgpetersenii TaxID=174 RepID=M3HW85_LEPBO|nr:MULTISPECIES: hypothetical protein [Leptospira]EMG01865.1 hypothetical protein LEP1GSC123_0361 [Leptospira borgpetersenii str. 200701203]AXX16412.1 hypothetical protein C4Q31_13415 [Leptospira borgpetersenii serovar Ceylonica]EKP15138.1 hypothetical protein LEP1GSC128_2223 [Leptospira borgpetersenii str. 200801926]EKQ90286.1 hypothetical protein LEP1GSC101_2052 [Leptospira borgpetersenii str. UI 09149]EMK12659.1 hypothetical protein LEP1GSC066_3709 [Leptospira sp. serovar Kenya str. Sh9]
MSEKLEASICKKAEASKANGKKFSTSEQIQNLPYYLRNLEDLPSLIRFLIQRIMDKLGIE